MTGPAPRRSGIDALADLALEGGREAARNVGRVVGRDVQAGPAQVLAAPDGAGLLRLVGRPDAELVAVAMELQEPVGGRLVLLVSADEAERVAQALVPDAVAGSLDTVGESALVELGNIAGSAFVSTLARRLGVRLLHGVPRLTRGNPRACLERLAPGAAGPAVGVRFGCPESSGTLLLLPDPARTDALAGLLETR